MLLAEIKGNKVHFWRLVTFFLGRGVYLLPTDPLEVSLGGHLLEILSLRGGVRPPRTPLRTSMGAARPNAQLYTHFLSLNFCVRTFSQPLPPLAYLLKNETSI